MSHPISRQRRKSPLLVDDVLIHVFSYLPLEGRVAVSHASPHFRAVVTHVPSLWTTINIRSGSKSSMHFLETLLARSARRNIDLFVQAPHLTPSAAASLMSHVATHLHRTRTLSLQLSVRHRRALLSALITPAPVLESATLCFFDTPSDDPWDLVADELPTTLFAGHAPALRAAAFDAVFLPADGVPALGRVRALTVEYSAETVLDLAAFRRNAPEAESLGVALGLRYTDLPAVVPAPGFARLRKLVFYMTAGRALSSPNFASILCHLQCGRIPDVTVHYRGAVPRADLMALLGRGARVSLGFLYERAPLPLSRGAAHALRNVAFSVSSSTASQTLRTISWYDFSPRTLARPADLPRRMLRAAVTPAVTSLEVAGSAAWDALADAYSDKDVALRRVAELTFAPQPRIHGAPGPPPTLFPNRMVFFPALRRAQLRASGMVEAAAEWPAFLRSCVTGADARPPPYRP